MTDSGNRGVFHAVVTRDAQARDRDGQTFLDANRLAERVAQETGALWEVEFEDGVWMLARTPDLIFAS